MHSCPGKQLPNSHTRTYTHTHTHTNTHRYVQGEENIKAVGTREREMDGPGLVHSGPGKSKYPYTHIFAHRVRRSRQQVLTRGRWMAW